jgi:hypothetical protein
MKYWYFPALVALLAFPACLDSIVGTKCANGYSACGGKCVPTGSCKIGDAGTDADGDGTEMPDADSVESGLDDDGGAVDAPFAVDEQPFDDAEEDDTPAVPTDVVPRVDAGRDGTGTGTSDTVVSADDAEAALPVEPEPIDADLDAPENPPIDLDAATVDAPNVDLDAAVDGAAVDSPVVSDLGGDALTLDDATTDGATDDGSRIDAPSVDLPPCLGCEDGGDASGDDTFGDDAVDHSDGGADAIWTPTDADSPDAPAVETGPLVCSAPQSTICDNKCVDVTSSAEYCGDCFTMCTSNECQAGKCLDCAPENVCNHTCINYANDADNCGGCGSAFFCPSGLCSNSHCELSGTGRVIVIGHDYLNNRRAMNQLLGNAVFLWPVNPVNILIYKGDANADAISGADQAIAQVAGTTRVTTKTEVVAGDLAPQLAAVDVFLIYGQERASDTTLDQLGLAWRDALLAFANRGGTVIVLDGYYGVNTGTVRILSSAGLLGIERKARIDGDRCTVVARGDAVASGLVTAYRCEPNSVSFTVTETGPTITTVVASGTPTASPVVVTKLF